MSKQLFTLAVALGLMISDAEAQKKSPKPPAQKTGKSRRPMVVTPEREAHVMAFLKQHHPELRDLLASLKEDDTRAYQRAVRDLFRTSERLMSVQEKYPAERYELELKIWKAKSRSALLATQFKVTKDAKLRDQLRIVVNEQIDLQLELLRRERQRHLDRLKRVEKQIQSLDKGRKRTVERQVVFLTKDRRPARNKKPSRVSTGSKKSKSTSKSKSTNKGPGQGKPAKRRTERDGG